MSKPKLKLNIAMVIVFLSVSLGLAGRLLAQSTDDSDPTIRLYVDPETHIVYTVPGRGRRLLTEVPASALSTRNLEERQDQTDQKLDQERARIAELAAQNEQLQSNNDVLSKQVTDIKPAWKDYTDNFQDKFRDWHSSVRGLSLLHTYRISAAGITQLTNPGPYNNNWNSFDITRTYLNFYFFPTKDWTVRLTPTCIRRSAPPMTRSAKIRDSAAIWTAIRACA